MPKMPTAKERIIELSRTLSPVEIAVTIGTSIQYVNKVLKNAATSENKPLLTLQNYVMAHCKGITKKNDLATFFGVSRMTINRFENRPEIKHHFARYMELRNNGYCIDQITHHLTQILETLSLFEPNSDITNNLKQAVTILTKYDKLTN